MQLICPKTPKCLKNHLGRGKSTKNLIKSDEFCNFRDTSFHQSLALSLPLQSSSLLAYIIREKQNKPRKVVNSNGISAELRLTVPQTTGPVSRRTVNLDAEALPVRTVRSPKSGPASEFGRDGIMCAAQGKVLVEPINYALITLHQKVGGLNTTNS